ncbi:hypothetical protein KXV85_006141, partial [Aspergillus fumigatus]
IFGQGQTAVLDMGFMPAIGAAGPIGAVEQLAKGRHRLDTGQRIGGAHQTHDLPPAFRGTQQAGQFLVIAFGRAARPGDDVHRIAKLLQHRIMRDGADLAQRHRAVRGHIALAAALAAAGIIEQAEAKGGQRAAVGRTGQMALLNPADRAVEVEGEV